jgi:hypothetical protein
MPKLASCRAEGLGALRHPRRAGWRIGIVTNGLTDNQLSIEYATVGYASPLGPRLRT